MPHIGAPIGRENGGTAPDGPSPDSLDDLDEQELEEKLDEILGADTDGTEE